MACPFIAHAVVRHSHAQRRVDIYETIDWIFMNYSHCELSRSAPVETKYVYIWVCPFIITCADACICILSQSHVQYLRTSNEREPCHLHLSSVIWNPINCFPFRHVYEMIGAMQNTARPIAKNFRLFIELTDDGWHRCNSFHYNIFQSSHFQSVKNWQYWITSLVWLYYAMPYLCQTSNRVLEYHLVLTTEHIF